MKHIRPHEALMLFQTDRYEERLAPLVLPDLYTPSVLETCVLITLLRHVEADSVFEFGTFRGINTLNLIANMKSEGRIFTLDLDDESRVNVEQHPNDADVTRLRFEWGNRLAFLGTEYHPRVTQLFGNSVSYDFSPFKSTMNMVWVDGGHDLDTVQSDTRNAFDMIDQDRAGVIAWHDYRNPHYPELTEYLDDMSDEHDLLHVEDTMIVFSLNKGSEKSLQ